MTDVERFLLDYWHARRSIGRLMSELKMAKIAYEQCASEVPVSNVAVRAGGRRNGGTSPVERAAVLLVDQMGAEVAQIERRLSEERRAIAHIEAVVGAAGLSLVESEYVRQRYFENRTVASVAQRLYCSTATCGRIKRSALDKVRAAMDERHGSGAAQTADGA